MNLNGTIRTINSRGQEVVVRMKDGGPVEATVGDINLTLQQVINDFPEVVPSPVWNDPNKPELSTETVASLIEMLKGNIDVSIKGYQGAKSQVELLGEIGELLILPYISQESRRELLSLRSKVFQEVS